MDRRPPRSLLALATVIGGVAFAAAPASAGAAGWSATASFASAPASTSPDEGAASPRVGVAADGTAVVAYRRTLDATPNPARELRAAVGGPSGRFGASALLTGAFPTSWSAAARPGGDRLVAWSTVSGLRAAWYHGGRWTVRRLTTEARSEIDDVQAAADPRGGWVLVATQFVFHVTAVQALDLAPDGRVAAPARSLQVGSFGNEARPVFALAVDPGGRAFFAYRYDGQPLAPSGPAETRVRVRPHGGSWGEPVSVPGVVDARVSPDPEGGAVLAGTRPAQRGDAGTSGAPVTAGVRPDGTVTAPVGPAVAHPARAFGPSAVALAGGRRLVVGSLKSGADAFSRVAPVAAATLAPGRPQPPFAFVTLPTARVSEPIAVPLAGHRALVSWAGQKGWGALLASANGVLSATAVPPGSPPVPYHFNATNRDLRSAGRRVVLAWERGDRVRVTTRAF